MQSPVNWALLGLIIERPSYAYELARRFQRTYDGALSISAVSHIYIALAALKDRELVAPAPGSNERARSRRRYVATREGIALHSEWVVSQLGDERRRQRVLIAQLGAMARTPGQALAALDAYERSCISELADAPPVGSDEGPGTTRMVARLIAEDTRLALAARLRWVQYARAQLLALAPVSTGIE
ncbi:MAG TPA: PadR family transcriptional regulator [Solirubrobacteraceae bacterium]|nr:PadR family transcriptional regulator [Solirubrobacteraceae bacterium]